MSARFAGTRILLGLAKLLDRHLSSSDVRLHPLRISAAILTPLYAFVGLVPVLIRKTRYHWRRYAALYGGYCVLSLYTFYPYDMPSIALISVAAFLILEEQLGAGLIVMLLTGVFRESSLHVAWFVCGWAICNRNIPLGRRLMWAVVYCIAFVLEYFVIRMFYPVYSSSNRLDLYGIFFGRGLWSLSCLVTLSIVAIVPICYLVRQRSPFGLDWRTDFFVLNCVVTPVWIVFYRFMGGNISELRMVIPVLLPLFYGLAIRSARPHLLRP